MGTEAPGVFCRTTVYGCNMLLINIYIKKRIMQKIDKKLCIVYRKAAMKAERYKWCGKQKKLDYLTCPGQGQAAGLY